MSSAESRVCVDVAHDVAARLDALAARVGELVAAAGATSGPLHGWFLAPERAAALASTRPGIDAHGDERDPAAAPDGAALRRLPAAGALADFAARTGIDTVDVELLVIAAAPDVDPRMERLYGFLHDDLTRRRASVGLALELSGLSPRDPLARARLDGGALARHALLRVEGRDGPALGRALVVPDRVVSWLIGDGAPEQALRDRTVAAVALPALDRSEATPAREAVRAWEATGAVHVLDRGAHAATHVVAAALSEAGHVPLIVDAGSCAAGELDELVQAVVRHAALTGEVPVVRGVEHVAATDPRLIGRLASAAVGCVLVTSAPWDPAWSASAGTLRPPTVVIGDLSRATMRRLWHDALAAEAEPDAVSQVVAGFHLSPEQVRDAAALAGRAARAGRAKPAHGASLTFGDLSAAARSVSASGLDRLAKRIEPTLGWEDLVLPGDVMVLLRDLARRVRWREQVMETWGLRRGWRGHGITALFAGPSGTGKTTAAEVIAGELGYDVHVVDLSSVVDKYIGETEKKLEVIFSEAERTNSVLLFDEADAIFGKRSEVKDARDRYANIEVSYLLQRMERFRGLAILTTNLGANLDDAFTRRLDVVVDFPRPDANARTDLWRRELRPTLPVEDLDLRFCAEAFDLTGGNIRNVVTTAAFLAADRGHPVTMAELVVAVQREYRKMGRLCVPGEFGRYAGLLGQAGAGQSGR